MDPWPPVVVHPPDHGLRRVTVEDGRPLGVVTTRAELYVLLVADGWDETDLVPDDAGLVEWRGGTDDWG